MKQRLSVAVGLALAVLVGTVGVASAIPLRHPRTKAATEVLRILTDGNATVQRDKATTDWSAISKDFTKTATELRGVHYPKDARADATTLESALDELAYDTAQIAGVAKRAAEATPAAVSAASALLTTVVSDEGAELAASDALRAVLGLPQAKA